MEEVCKLPWRLVHRKVLHKCSGLTLVIPSSGRPAPAHSRGVGALARCPSGRFLRRRGPALGGSTGGGGHGERTVHARGTQRTAGRPAGGASVRGALPRATSLPREEPRLVGGRGSGTDISAGVSSLTWWEGGGDAGEGGLAEGCGARTSRWGCEMRGHSIGESKAEIQEPDAVWGGQCGEINQGEEGEARFLWQW